MFDTVDTEKEFDYYRRLYISNINNGGFSWEAAHYYYTSTSDRIDVFPLQDFKDSVMQEIQKEGQHKVLSRIMAHLDDFYGAAELLTADGTFIKMC